MRDVMNVAHAIFFRNTEFLGNSPRQPLSRQRPQRRFELRTEEAEVPDMFDADFGRHDAAVFDRRVYI